MISISIPLSVITQLLLILVLIVLLIDAIYSIVNRRKLNRSIDALMRRWDILMTIPIKKARQYISEELQGTEKEKEGN